MTSPLLAVTALSLFLASCGLFDDPPPPCPRVAIMDQAKKLILYRPGPGRDLTDVTYEIEMRDLAYECDYDYDFDDAGNSVTVNFNVLFIARRGPAAERDRVEVPYFSAVTTASRHVLAKELFTVVLEFSDNDVRTQVVEELAQTIPFPSDIDVSEYHSFVGLQLTPEQLKESKRDRGQ